MDYAQTWITTFIDFGGLMGTLVTAVATLFLWRVTKLLAQVLQAHRLQPM